MVLLKAKFDLNNRSKRTRLHQSLKHFLGEYAPEPPNTSVAAITIYFSMNVVILYSEFFQTIKPNASIVVCF